MYFLGAPYLYDNNMSNLAYVPWCFTQTFVTKDDSLINFSYKLGQPQYN